MATSDGVAVVHVAFFVVVDAAAAAVDDDDDDDDADSATDADVAAADAVIASDANVAATDDDDTLRNFKSDPPPKANTVRLIYGQISYAIIQKGLETEYCAAFAAYLKK